MMKRWIVILGVLALLFTMLSPRPIYACPA
jgi:hypothetical protein